MLFQIPGALLQLFNPFDKKLASPPAKGEFASILISLRKLP